MRKKFYNSNVDRSKNETFIALNKEEMDLMYNNIKIIYLFQINNEFNSHIILAI